MTLEDALADLRRRKLMPTSLGSAGLRRLAAEVRRHAVFSARMTHAEVVRELQRVVQAMAAGQINLADARLSMKYSLALAGYEPETGFPGDDAKGVPPAEPGSLQDLRSRKRLDLMLETNYRMAANRAYAEAGQSETRRWQFPAWELLRIYTRRIPRGYKATKGGLVEDPGEDWIARWRDAGGTLVTDDDGTDRMIATKDDSVWADLGTGEGGHEKDSIGNPWPPFAFQSGFGIREVSREDCIRLGVIDGNELISETPQTGELRVAADRVPAALRQALRKELAAGKQPGTLTLAQRVEEEAYAAVETYRAQAEKEGGDA